MNLRLRWEKMQGDDGVALVMALIFIVVVGLFATVALDKNAATSLSGQQVLARSQLQYALDGGVDRGLQMLRDEMASGAPTSCTAPSEPDGTGSLSLNGHTVTYTCRTLAGRAATSADASTTNYALVTTDTAAGALTSQSGVAQDLQIAGSVYLNGPVANSDVGKPIEITDGDLVSPKSGSCQSNLDALTNVKLIGTGQLRACTEQTLAQALPTVSLPTAPTVNIATSLGSGVEFVIGSRKCTVFYPGRYSSPPSLGNNSKNYFVSGLYYFDFPGQWQVDDATIEVVAGARASGSTTDTAVPANDCSAMSMTDTVALNPLSTGFPVAQAPVLLAHLPVISPYVFSHGATWVFGGSARLDVKKGAFTMFSPPAGGSTVPVNLVGASAYTHPSYTQQTLGTPMLTGGGNNSAMEVNGKLFAPRAYVEVFSTNNTVAAVRGGVVAFRAQLKASASGSDALVISASGTQGNPPPPFRTVVVETVDAGGGSTAKNRAVATISNFSPFTVTLLSWRTE